MTHRRVVIAHDYLTQRGGAERVVLAMMKAFPDAQLVTSIYNEETTFAEFRNFDVRSSWLSKVEMFRDDPRRAFPLLAPTWSRISIDADVVLCSSSGWSHGVRTTAPKVVYCHNPARWLYQPSEYLEGSGRGARAGVKALGSRLRAWDQRAARSATRYVANSSVVATRINDTYGIEAPILHPPAAVSGGAVEPVPGISPGFLLTVGRSRGYKNTDAIVESMHALPDERLVVVGGPIDPSAPASVICLNDLTDAQLRWLYSNASALVACAYEDFGLTPIEAFTVGTPVVALRAGGYLDTMVPGVTGEFVAAPEPEQIAGGVRRLRQQSYSATAIRSHAESFSLDRFASEIRGIVLDDELAGTLVA